MIDERMFITNDDEQEELTNALNLLRKALIKSAMERMTRWQRIKFRIFLLWLRVRRVFI